MTNILRHSLFAGLMLIAQVNVWAAENLEKIYIDADYMQLNIETGYSVYVGNVNIKQGQLILTGDKVTIQQSKKEVERITVTGKPAHYNHITDKGENIQAESEKMVYTASENKLVMTINANLKQPDHQVSSQKIVYDTEKKIVIAGDKRETSTGSDNKQRVNITLTPKKDPAKEQE
jgi:lipopolysaccharide export system protein LptA